MSRFICDAVLLATTRWVAEGGAHEHAVVAVGVPGPDERDGGHAHAVTVCRSDVLRALPLVPVLEDALRLAGEVQRRDLAEAERRHVLPLLLGADLLRDLDRAEVRRLHE